MAIGPKQIRSGQRTLTPRQREIAEHLELAIDVELTKQRLCWAGNSVGVMTSAFKDSDRDVVIEALVARFSAPEVGWAHVEWKAASSIGVQRGEVNSDLAGAFVFYAEWPIQSPTRPGSILDSRRGA